MLFLEQTERERIKSIIKRLVDIEDGGAQTAVAQVDDESDHDSDFSFGAGPTPISE